MRDVGEAERKNRHVCACARMCDVGHHTRGVRCRRRGITARGATRRWGRHAHTHTCSKCMRAGDEISSTTYAPHAMHVRGVGSAGQGRAATNTQRRCLQWKQQRRARPTTRARRSHTHPRAHWTPHTSKLARTLYSRHEQGYAGPVAHTSVPLSTLTGSLTRFAHAQPDPEIVGDGHNAALTHDAARSQYKWTHSRAQPTTAPL